MLSKCCKAFVWLICGRLKLDAMDEEALKKIPRGKTCFYACDKCENACDILGEQ